MHPKHKGARSELAACIWLLDQGYEVFRNVSAHGLVDIVIMKDWKTTLIDVRSARPKVRTLTRLSKVQIDNGVLPLYVFADGRCEINYKPIPQGLSNKEWFTCPNCGERFTAYRRPKQTKAFCTTRCKKLYLQTHRLNVGSASVHK
jgi:hypothetical protein